MGRTLLQRIHNPHNWTCHCDESCVCKRTLLGRALRWYIPARFHRFPQKQQG
jgi:hypothetical protein